MPYAVDVQNGSASADVEDILSTAPGVQSAGATLGAGSDWYMIVAAFRPLGSCWSPVHRSNRRQVSSPGTSVGAADVVRHFCSLTAPLAARGTMPDGRPSRKLPVGMVTSAELGHYGIRVLTSAS